MNISKLISSIHGIPTPDSLVEFANTQENNFRSILLKVADKASDIEGMVESGTLSLVSGKNRMKPAVFVAKQLDGSVYVGWHFAPIETAPGERFHFDHGCGNNANLDGEYVWFAPVTAFINFSFNPESKLLDGLAWQPIMVNINSKLGHSFEREALLVALNNGSVHAKPPTAYVSLFDPSNSPKGFKTHAFNLGY